MDDCQVMLLEDEHLVEDVAKDAIRELGDRNTLLATFKGTNRVFART
jgi:hypothetical protein